MPVFRTRKQPDPSTIAALVDAGGVVRTLDVGRIEIMILEQVKTAMEECIDTELYGVTYDGYEFCIHRLKDGYPVTMNVAREAFSAAAHVLNNIQARVARGQ